MVKSSDMGSCLKFSFSFKRICEISCMISISETVRNEIFAVVFQKHVFVTELQKHISRFRPGS